MSKFRYFNVSLLPIDGKTESEVGEDGYRSLIEEYGKIIRKANDDRQLEKVSFKLRNDMFFSALHVYFGEGHAYGTLVKFDQPDAIQDLYTGAEVTKVARGGSAHRYLFDFVFDYSKHTLAIHNAYNKLPSTQPTLKAIEFFFNSIATQKFPKHQIQVGQIVSSAAVSNTLQKAKKFKRGEVEVTFTNSAYYEDALVQEIQNEMKENATNKVTVIESSARDGFMNDFSRRFKALLRLAQITTGNGFIRYLDRSTNRLSSFHMRNHPLELTVSQESEESDAAYRQRIRASIQQAVTQGKEKVLGDGTK
ncbi:MAG: DUF4747 family protein [Paraburkholderia sp.]|uniref:DUF4747 family protein n=1 Tax=Paraburkholderia sp. TaxID=1926495 RepID=UPI00120D3D2B|nr:DUF4747 family protein [Paraburkholderia sp.]TAM04240.1 MAG: DUF4747 family protein [Paraburkholderia sp.]TAM29686.1 MAG: DUF4747 family protein [Paraburkholderia sp.]